MYADLMAEMPPCELYAEAAHSWLEGMLAGAFPDLREGHIAAAPRGSTRTGTRQLQPQAWKWAASNRLSAGELPTGEAIAEAFGRSQVPHDP